MRTRTAVKWRGLAGVAVGLVALWGGRAWAAGTPYPVTFDVSQVGLGDGPTAVAVADFNNDGKIDLAVTEANSNSVNIFLNTETGFPAVADHTLTPSSLKSPQGIVARETKVGDPNHPLNEVPNGIAADFNGDGKADFAVTNYDGESVSVFLGNGDGTFSVQPPIAVQANPLGIAAARLRGASANLDLVVVDDTTVSGGSITVLHGNGDGTFSVQYSLTVGNKPRRIAIGDFGKPGYPLEPDGVPDFAVTLYGDNAVAVLYGNGDGTVTAVTPSFSTDPGPNGIVVADFNNDGYPDLATANHKGYGHTVDVLFGHNTSGNLSFWGKQPLSVPAAYGITALELSGDNQIDLAVTGGGSGTSAKVELLRNTMDLVHLPGNANFTRVDCDSDNGPKGIVAADFNGDGNADLAVANQASDVVSIRFAPLLLCPTPVQIGTLAAKTPVALALCNVTDATGNGGPDANGTLDLLVLDQSTGSVVIFGGDGHGNFTLGANPVTVPSCTTASSIVCNGCDGFSVTCQGKDSAYAFCKTDGWDWDQIGDQLNAPKQIIYADLNGSLDWAIANKGNHTLSVSCASQTSNTVAQPISVAAGAFHGFCNVTNQTTCKTSADCPTGETCIRPTDLVVASSYSNSIQPFFNNGACSFTAGPPYDLGHKPGSSTVWNKPVWVTAADIGGDGLADIITANNNTGADSVTVLKALGGGYFASAAVYTAGSGPKAVVAADFNRDGYPDVAVAENAGDVVSLLLGSSSGTLSNCPAGTSCCEYTGGDGPIAIQAGNINNLDDPNGVPDLVVVDGVAITILVNTTPPLCPPTQCGGCPTTPCP